MVESIMVASATLWSLQPRTLADLQVPIPSPLELRLFCDLIQQSERAYWRAREAADIRRTTLRDHIVGHLLRNGSS